MFEDLSLAISQRAGIVHLEPPHRGGRASSLINGGAAIAAIHVQGVLGLPRDVGLLLFLLRHF